MAGDRVARRLGPLHRPGPRRPAGRRLRPRHPVARRRLHHDAGGRRPGDGCCLILVTPDARAHDEHLPGCVVAARARRHRPRRRSRRAAGRPTSRATCSTGPRPRTPSVPRPTSPTRPGARWRSRCRTCSASSATATPSASWSASHVDILFANDAEILALYEVDDFDGRGRRRPAPTARSPCSPAASWARSIVTPDEVVEVPASPSRPGRHHRRRRPVRRRLPVRPHPGQPLGDVRAARRHRRGRGHQPPRAPTASEPGRRSPSPSWVLIRPLARRRRQVAS